jgi:glycerol kinase
MQFQADVLQVPVVRPRITETTALGAAYLAGLAVGYWASEAEVAANWQEQRRFLPAIPASQAEALRGEWSRAVERSKDWARD